MVLFNLLHPFLTPLAPSSFPLICLSLQCAYLLRPQVLWILHFLSLLASQPLPSNYHFTTVNVLVPSAFCHSLLPMVISTPPQAIESAKKIHGSALGSKTLPTCPEPLLSRILSTGAPADLPLTLLPPTLCASYHFTSSLSADYLVLYLTEKTRGTLNFPYPASLRQTHPNRNPLVAFLWSVSRSEEGGPFSFGALLHLLLPPQELCSVTNSLSFLYLHCPMIMVLCYCQTWTPITEAANIHCLQCFRHYWSVRHLVTYLILKTLYN